MRQIHIFVCFLFMFFGLNNTVQATILTVSNDPSLYTAQYTSISTAVSAAGIGDTLYIHPTGITYPGFNLTKRLTLVGIGHRSIRSGLGSLIANLSHVNVYNGSSGSSLIGLQIGYINFLDNGLTNLLFNRCRFVDNSYNILFNNYDIDCVFEGCVFNRTIQDIDDPGSAILFINNVFSSNSSGYSMVNIVNAASIQFVNNVFLGSYSSPIRIGSNVTGALFVNNVFHGRTVNTTPGSTDFNGVVFSNNIFQTTGIAAIANLNAPFAVVNTDPDGDNLFLGASDIVFESNPSTANKTNFAYDQDYNTVVAIGGGQGVQGSTIGLLEFNDNGTPFNPVIQEVIMLTPVVGGNDTIRFRVKAVSQNNDGN
ncbi:MAG: hypothetical protein ACKV1O_20080 [Saprospiraceae bacterium]